MFGLTQKDKKPDCGGRGFVVQWGDFKKKGEINECKRQLQNLIHQKQPQWRI